MAMRAIFVLVLSIRLKTPVGLRVLYIKVR